MQGNTDEEDSLTLGLLFSPETVDKILEVKHNECYRDELYLSLLLRSYTLAADEKVKAWKRVGEILSTSTFVTSVRTLANGLYDLDMPWLCAGLQYNKNIKDFTFCGIDLGGATKMNSLAPFLSNSRSLREITLFKCSVGQAAIDIFANALMNRTTDTLKSLDLFGNNLGDCNLDRLITSLSTCTKLISLSLCSNGIGQGGCNSLAQLLKSPESNLECLHLDDNSIDDETVKILSGSLTNNTKLRRLYLDGNNITASGWMSLLELVCDTSSITAVKDSNHTIYCLWLVKDPRNAIISALGVDKSNLLFASLELNNEWWWRANRLSPIIRQKMILSHARGGINIAQSDIPDSAMPVVLSWFGDYSNKETAHLIKYHDPPLPQEVVNTKRLDSFYRIVLERPLKLCENRQPNVDDVSQLTDTLAQTSLG